MKTEIRFPQLSTKIEAGTIVEWHKKVGESFETGEVLYDVESSKTISEVEATFSGKLLDIKAEEGDEVNVGDLLAIAESKEEL